VSVRTDSEGRYYIARIPAGTYAVALEAPGFRSETIEALNVDAGRTLVRDFRLAVGERRETVFVRAEVRGSGGGRSCRRAIATAQAHRLHAGG